MRAIQWAASLLLLPVTVKPLRRAAILAALILGVWVYVPYRSALASVVTPLYQRAAFSWEERFDDGLEHWVNASALVPDRSGAVRVEGLAIPGKGLNTRNYELDFSARIQKKSLGWVVRARNETYTFKLTDRGRTPTGRKLELTRPNQTTVPVVVPGAGDFLDISVRVTDDQVLTTVNGYGVDAWKHPKFDTSSIGLLADKGEPFLVKSVTLSGNADLLGVFLKNLMSLAAAKIG